MKNINIEVPKSVDNAISNLTDEPTRNIGKTLSDIWFLVFGRISQRAEMKRIKYANDLELFKSELDESVSKIPDDKLIEPDFQTTAQALDAAKYCISSEELRTMFVNLISGSMNSDYEDYIHPSFPEILKQMNSNDAKLLSIMKKATMLPAVSLGLNIDDSSGSYHPIADNVLHDYPDIPSEIATLSASSLERAGLITISTLLNSFTDKSAYEPFKELAIYKEIEKQGAVMENPVHISKGICALTALGKSFVTVCLP